MRYGLILFLFFSSLSLYSQEETSSAQLYLESDLSASDGDEVETDDPELKLFWYRNHKININKVTASFLAGEFDVDPLIAEQLITYRKLAGDLIDILELQAVPGWTPDLIRGLIPFITINEQENLVPLLRERYRKGRHLFQFRTGFAGERSAGYLEKEPGGAAFRGDRTRALIRYNFRAGTLLQWGLTVEKDAGEKLLNSKTGFDFSSFYISIGSVGKLKALYIGDFNANLGQGLIHWQSNAVKKSAETILTLKQAAGVRAHGGAGEHQFHRGIAVEFDFYPIRITAFLAGDRWDVNIEGDSSAGINKRHISSIQSSGLHRTVSEFDNRNAAIVYVAGLSLSVERKNLIASVNGVQHFFPYAIQKAPSPENLYALSGSSLTNFSLDYRYRYRNLFLFGEIASSNRNSLAGLNGLIAAIHPRLDLSALIRIVPPSYRAIQANAFTESTEPNNEQGFYLGFKLSAMPGLVFSGYADVFRFPWVKSQVSIPSRGSGTLLQLLWKPDKKNEFVFRLQKEEKLINGSGDDNPGQLIQQVSRQLVRLQQKWQPGKSVEIVSRMDLVRYSKERLLSETGFLVYADVMVKPAMKAWSFAFRWTRFKSTGYDSRTYTTERDLRNYHSLTMLSGDGWRIYFLLNYKFSKYVRVSVKTMLTYYIDKQTIGSDLMEISRPYRSEYRLQFLHFF